MANKWSPEQKAFLDINFTVCGRMLFPNLLKARLKDKATRETFDGQFVWVPGENAQVTQAIFQWLQQGIQMFHTGCNPAALVNPIKDFNTYQRQDARENAEYLRGTLWVNASSGKEFPPQVIKQTPVGPVRLTEADAAEVYSGRNVVFNISFYPIIPAAGSTNQKRGFSVNINAVLLQDGGDQIGGSSAVDINKAFSGFMGDMGGAFNPGMGAPAAGGFPGGQPAPAANPGWGAPAPTAAPAPNPGWGQPASAPAAAPNPAWGAPAPTTAPAPAPNPGWGAPAPAAAPNPGWGQPAPAAPAANTGFAPNFNNPGFGR